MADVRDIARSRRDAENRAPTVFFPAVPMSKLLRKPKAILWILSLSQAVGMLVLNVALRAAVA